MVDFPTVTFGGWKEIVTDVTVIKELTMLGEFYKHLTETRNTTKELQDSRYDLVD